MMKLLLICIASLALVSCDEDQKLTFASKIFIQVVDENPAKNIIISPASIYSCLGLAYLGAEGTTAAELKDVLEVEGNTKEEIAQYFGEFIKRFNSRGYEETTKFTIANRVYVDKKYEVEPKFNELATKYLKSIAETVNFGDSVVTANKINTWVSEQTNNRINDIVSSGTLDSSTSAVLVNAIYFKAHWEEKFEIEDTKKKDFFSSETEKTPVDMMFKEEYYKYADWDEVDATALQIPYANTDIYMLVVLPKKVNGLKTVAEKLKTANLQTLHDRFESKKVRLHLPKFKFEFDTTLNGVLSKMGIKSMFSGNADFGSLLKSKQPLPVSEVVHKAFIEVDELGTEAAAATMIIVPMMAVIRPKDAIAYEFNVDHPFIFAIKNKNTTYFAGQVTKV